MLSRRSFLSVTGTAVLGAAALALSGCGESRGSAQSSSAAAAAQSSAVSAQASSSASSASQSASQSASVAKSDSLVIYFSHAGENYGVGYIDPGNTAVVAGMIAQATGADQFEIVPAQAYPESYQECCDVALEEQHAGARPAYAGDVDISSYKTIYLGYPIWWGDLPMCVYTFLEAHDWAGKEIRPFCTHAGSGLGNTVSAIGSKCTGANVGQGLSIAGTTVQNSPDEARAAAEAWLK